MSEIVTVVIMLVLAFFGGTIVTIILGKSKNMASWTRIYPVWFLNCFFELWILYAFRVMLLKDRELVVYSQDVLLIFFDIALLIFGGVLICYFYQDSSINSNVRNVTSIIILFMYYGVVFAFLFWKYRNINATIYNIFSPSITFYFGVVLFGINLLVAQKDKEKEYTMKWAVICLFVVTMFIYPVVETYITNVAEFSFSVSQVWHRSILIMAIVFLALNILYKLLNDKLKNIFLFMLWSISICAYIQSMFLNSKLFLMDGKESEWSIGVKVCNIVVWGISFAILFFIYRFKKKELVVYSSLGLCIMQVIGGISLLPNYTIQVNDSATAHNYLSVEGLYEVAKEENIIIFVLDTYDVDFMDEVLMQYPDFLSPLNGFTYFQDTVSQYSRTFPSIPYMLTEQEYFYEIPQEEYVDTAFEKCLFWNDLKKKDFVYYLYEENEAFIGKSVRSKAQNYQEDGHVIDEKISIVGLAEAIIRINNYRLLPYALKEYYMYTSSTINNLVIQEQEWDIPMYVADDIEVYKGLKDNRLQLSEERKALRFIHLNGAHAPYTMTSEGTEAIGGVSTPVEQYIGCMNLVYDYLDMLKELGMYEASTIIITADHGENYVTTQLEQNTNPILFIKPAGVGTGSKLQISDVSASQNDMLPTIAAMYGIKYDESWGIDLFHVQDQERIRYHYYAVVENTLQTKTRTYEIKGSSLDFANWNATDEYHEFGEYY